MWLQVDLKFSEAAIKAIATKALARKTGARGLRSILEALLLDAMFDTPGSPITAVQVDEEVVIGKKRLEYIMKVVETVTEELKEAESELSKERANN